MQPLKPTNPPPARPSLKPRILFSTSLMTTFFSSLLVLAFKADSFFALNNATDGGRSVSTGHLLPNDDQGPLLAEFPAVFFNPRFKSIIASASFSLILTLGMGCLGAIVWRRKKPVVLTNLRPVAMSIFTLLSLSCGISLILWLLALSHHLQSSHFDPDHRSPAKRLNGTEYGFGGAYDGGVFDLGAWSCQMSKSYPSFAKGTSLRRQCVDESGALWSGLGLVLGGLAMVVVVVLDWRGKQFLIRSTDNARKNGEENEHLGERW